MLCQKLFARKFAANCRRQRVRDGTYRAASARDIYQYAGSEVRHREMRISGPAPLTSDRTKSNSEMTGAGDLPHKANRITKDDQ